MIKTTIKILLCIFWIPIVSFSQTNEKALPLTLKEALSMATQNYPSIKLKLAEKEASGFELKSVENNYLPNLIIQGQVLNGTSNQVRGAFFPNEGMAIPVSGGIKPNGYTGTSVWTSYATALINWKFFNFGKLQSAVNTANAEALKAEADYQNEIFQHQIKVGDAYLLLLMVNDMVRSSRANLIRVKALKDVTSAYTRSGLKPGVDSSIVKAEYSKATLQFLEARRNAKEQELYLKELLSVKGDSTPLQVDTTIYILREPQPLQVSDDFTKNTRLAYYKSIVGYNQAKIKSIRRKEYPSISFLAGSWARGSGIADKQLDNGDFQYDKSFKGGVSFRPYLDWMVGFSTIWNVTTFIKTGNESKAQRKVAVMAEEQYNEESLRVESELARAKLRYTAALEIARQAPIQLEASQEAYKQAKARYDAGLTTVLELTQTFALLNRAEVDALMARGNVWRAVIQYAAASGDMTIFTNNLQ